MNRELTKENKEQEKAIINEYQHVEVDNPTDITQKILINTSVEDFSFYHGSIDNIRFMNVLRDNSKNRGSKARLLVPQVKK